MQKFKILFEPISITSIASISSLGITLNETWAAYNKSEHFLSTREFDQHLEWVAGLSENSMATINQIRQSDNKYKNLDASVLYALYASRRAMRIAKWKSEDNFGINLGSSRGATSLFEQFHSQYMQEGKVATLASPTTTLGNISSWVAHDLQTKGPEISHSITCSTALHSLLNGVAWLRSGMVDKFMVGGSEAPLTPFTIAQMKALKIYAKHNSSSSHRFPCEAFNLDKSLNTMVLGEGASVACLERGVSDRTLATIEGVGYATEILKHNVSISAEAKCFQTSMQMALSNTDIDQVDVIVMHAPGTIKGDLSEYKAIEKVFQNKMPALTTNKWKLGHTFGASGMLSIEFAILMLQHQKFIEVPFVANTLASKSIKKVLVNAVGFGGNAVSVLLSLP